MDYSKFNKYNISSSLIYKLAILNWVVVSLFYAIEFFQRVSPSVMAKPIIASLHLDPAQLGGVISLYLYAYAIAQIPVGLILDKFNNKRILFLACLFISLGGILFAIGHSIVILAIARIIIGLSSAFAFIGVLKLTASWFPKEKYALMVGLTNTIGVIGAIFGEAPFAAMIEHLGWRESLIITSIVGIVVAFLILVLVKNTPYCLYEKDVCSKWVNNYYNKTVSIWRILKDILSSYQSWITGIYAGLMVSPIIAFGELWAVPFLSKAYSIDDVQAASLNTAIFVGIGFGGPINGWLISKINNKKILLVIENILAIISLIALIFFVHFNYFFLSALMFMTGFFISSMLYAFTLNKNRFSANHGATIVAFTNMFIMLTGAIYQELIGYISDLILGNQAHEQFSKYPLSSLQDSLVLLPITLFVALILLFFIKTHSFEENSIK